MKNVSTHDAFASKFLYIDLLVVLMVSTHRTKHHVHGRIIGIFQQKVKTGKHIPNIRNTQSTL